MNLLLQRDQLSPATTGRLQIDGAYECDTLELPWADNKTGISCIPPGTYTLAWEMSPRLKRFTLRLKGVPGRWGILIHPANEVKELKGCIALGMRYGNRIKDGTSRPAVEAVETKVCAALEIGDVVQIEIKNPEIPC